MKFKFELEDKHLKQYIEDAYIDFKKIQIINPVSSQGVANLYHGMYEEEKVLIRVWEENITNLPSNFIREVEVMRNQESFPYVSQLKKESILPV